jgi:hypothetical protein
MSPNLSQDERVCKFWWSVTGRFLNLIELVELWSADGEWQLTSLGKTASSNSHATSAPQTENPEFALSFLSLLFFFLVHPHRQFHHFLAGLYLRFPEDQWFRVFCSVLFNPSDRYPLRRFRWQLPPSVILPAAVCSHVD